MAPTTALTSRALVLLGLISTVLGGTADHRYKTSEHVELWVNKVGYHGDCFALEDTFPFCECCP